MALEEQSWERCGSRVPVLAPVGPGRSARAGAAPGWREFSPNLRRPSREQWLSAPGELSGDSQSASFGRKEGLVRGTNTFPGFGLESVAS